MPRTVINLDPKDKAWLDHEAKVRHVSMTELVRQAVRAYRTRQESLDRPNLQQALARTGGIWRSDDGLAYQRRLREEWDSR
jgi:predicted transcriptional regulator